MKRNLRIAALINELISNPGTLYTMNYFCDKFGIKKPSLSEDLQAANEVLSMYGNGYIRTSPGVGGGIKFIAGISAEECIAVQNDFAERLRDPKRILGGGFLYTNDIMYDCNLIHKLALIFSKEFASVEADYIVTVETKGIPLASSLAYVMNLPLIVIRREAKYAEDATVSINYFSGSYERIQRMSISKRSVIPGKNAIVIDDFMRGGGSLKGVTEILQEFDIKVNAVGVATVQREPVKKKIPFYLPLTIIENIDEKNKEIIITINDSLTQF